MRDKFKPGDRVVEDETDHGVVTRVEDGVIFVRIDGDKSEHPSCASDDWDSWLAHELGYLQTLTTSELRAHMQDVLAELAKRGT